MTKERRKGPAVLCLTLAAAFGLAAFAPSGQGGFPSAPRATARAAQDAPPPRERIPTFVSSWRLDEATGTTARDGWGTNHGTHAAGVAPGASGLVTAGLSADYDGAAGRTVVNSSASLNVAAALSLEAWVRPDTLPSSSATARTVIRKDGQYMLRILSSGAVVFRLWIGGVAREAVTPAGAVAAGGTYHLFASYDGAAQAVYVNGTVRVTRAQAGAVGTTANPLLLGASSSGGVYDFFDGRLDDVVLYGSAAGPVWVADRYNAGLCRPPFGAFDVGNWPSACWRPYADGSPFNQRLPPNPQLHPNSAQIVATVNGWLDPNGRTGPNDMYAGAAGTVHDYAHPVYYSRTTDPVYRIHCTKPWGTCEVEGKAINIPAAANPAAGGDGHMAVVDQRGGWEYDFWQVEPKSGWADGVINISWGGMTRIGTEDSTGLDSMATAAHFGLLAGVIRGAELEAGRINHALFIFVKCASNVPVYPSNPSAKATKCADPTYAPAEGQRLQLNMTDAEIDALAVPPWKKTILRAMAQYGMYVGDTGGSTWAPMFESGSSYTSFGYADPTVTFAQNHQGEGGITLWQGRYWFDLRTGVPWSRLRVIAPCVTQNNCTP